LLKLRSLVYDYEPIFVRFEPKKFRGPEGISADSGSIFGSVISVTNSAKNISTEKIISIFTVLM